MKRLLVILLAIQFSGGFWFAGELMGIPALVSHFIKHKADDPDESMLEFLAEHYQDAPSDDPNTHDHEHEHLPFNCSGHAHGVSFSLISPVPQTEKISIAIISQRELLQVSDESASSQNDPGTIWQPPRS